MKNPQACSSSTTNSCVQAEKLIGDPIAKMPDASMELAVKELQDVDITLPHALQSTIFNRAVSTPQDILNDGNAEQFMATVLLWTMRETGTEEVSGALAPNLAVMGEC